MAQKEDKALDAIDSYVDNLMARNPEAVEDLMRMAEAMMQGKSYVSPLDGKTYKPRWGRK